MRAALQLSGRTAVITGVASGIGRALALHAADRGMTVVGCDRDIAGIDLLTGELAARGCTAELHIADVSDPAAMAALAQAALPLPPIALLFANAGLLRKGSVLETSFADWRTLVNVNLLGAVATLQAFVPAMLAAGQPAQVVVTGSTGSMIAAPGLAAYCGTKHALWPVVEALREELAGSSVGASLLMPGAVATHIFDGIDPNRAAPADSMSPEQVANIAFAGALADLPKILTHPAYVARAEERFGRVVGELSAR
ncbi:MAG: SDR family NAD(P)-dependent oxidoreductase [Pseudomonadota bacterium]